MIIETINEACIITLDQKDQLRARDEFFRRLKDAPPDLMDRLKYAIAAGELFAEVFPEIAEQIKTLRLAPDEKKRPLFIKGFRLGRISHSLQETGPIDADERYGKDDVLGLAITYLMSGTEGGGMVGQNLSYGKEDPVHEHNSYAIVIGQHGVHADKEKREENIYTNLWYGAKKEAIDPDARFEIHRGCVLVIPPGMQHSVDGFPIGQKQTNRGMRNTLAYFPMGSMRADKKDIEEAKKHHILPARGAARE